MRKKFIPKKKKKKLKEDEGTIATGEFEGTTTSMNSIEGR